MKKLAVAALFAAFSLHSYAGQLVCRLVDGVAAQEIATAYGLTLQDQTVGGPFALFETGSDVSTQLLQDLLNADPRVVWAEDNKGFQTPEKTKQVNTQKGSTLPAVGDRVTSLGYNAVYLRQMGWAGRLVSTPGRRVRVAILDTGISNNAPGLLAKVDGWINAVEPGLPPFDMPRGHDSNNDGVYDARTGHGSMVAGIIDQVSPQSRFIICRVADSDGNATSWTLIKGLTFAVTSGAAVANVSLGASDRVPALGDVLEWCSARKLLVVAAAGNDAAEGELYPAAYGGTIGVAGVGAGWVKAPFSSYDRSVVVSAPSVEIVSTDWNGAAASWSGTSFAAPWVSAAVAEFFRSRTGVFSPSTIEAGLNSSGFDIDGYNPGFRRMLGRGLNFSSFVSGAWLGKRR